MLDLLKNLLRPPESKSSRAARLIAFENGGRARWTPRDYAALAREGWERVTAAPFLTINEKREATGYGPVEGGDGFG